MNNKVVLIVGAVLIAVGVFRPDLSSVLPNNNRPVVNTPAIEIPEPEDGELKDMSLKVAEILQAGDSSRKVDGLTLAVLWRDLGLLIAMDNENEVIKTTAEIREANSVAGRLINAELKGKYPDLAQTSRDVVVAAIGTYNVMLTEELRNKAKEAFMILSWAAYQGAQ